MKMKYIILLACPLVLGACNYLDYDETDNLKTKDNVYDYFASTKQVLTNVYSYLPLDFGVIGGAMRDCATDDAEYGASGGTIQDFNTGNWSATNTIDDAWNLYEGIRVANSFLEELKTVDFSRYQYTSGYENQMKQLATFEPQTRILRATYFFELARRYGDIAMPLEVLDLEGDRTIGKTAFVDVIQFIVDECDQYGKTLPDSYNSTVYGSEVGRVTRGYALALKSKALLYAASELHNPSMDVEKWKASAKAAWDLMDSKLYKLDPNGVANNSDSQEAVLMNRRNNDWTFELRNFPIRFTEGQRTSPAPGPFPSQNLVDAFETKNGYAVTLTANGFTSDDAEFNPAAPYSNRDPRFARTILADGMTFKNSTIDLKNGGLDYLSATEGGTPTGYFLKKYIEEATTFKTGEEAKFKHSWIIYRYAETLLTYAESMIYAFKDPNYKDAIYTKTALEALNEVRANAGMPAKSASNMAEFITMLRNEWRVEFAFEDHRFWDIRRWKIGADTQKELYGVKITKKDTNKSYSRFLYERRQWKQCMELYPIPQEKLFINTNLYPQNAGWN